MDPAQHKQAQTNNIDNDVSQALNAALLLSTYASPRQHEEAKLTAAILAFNTLMSPTPEQWKQLTSSIDWGLIPPAQIAQKAWFSLNPMIMASVPIDWLNLDQPPAQTPALLNLKGPVVSFQPASDSNLLVNNFVLGDIKGTADPYQPRHTVPTPDTKSIVWWGERLSSVMLEVLLSKGVTGNSVLTTRVLGSTRRSIKLIDALVCCPLEDITNTWWEPLAASASWSSPEEAATTLEAIAQTLVKSASSFHWSAPCSKQAWESIIAQVVQAPVPWSSPTPSHPDHSLAAHLIQALAWGSWKDQDQAWVNTLSKTSWSNWLALPLDQQCQEARWIVDSLMTWQTPQMALEPFEEQPLDPIVKISLLEHMSKHWPIMEKISKDPTDSGLAQIMALTSTWAVKPSPTMLAHAWEALCAWAKALPDHSFQCKPEIVQAIQLQYNALLKEVDSHHAINTPTLSNAATLLFDNLTTLARQPPRLSSQVQAAQGAVGLIKELVSQECFHPAGQFQPRPNAPARKM